MTTPLTASNGDTRLAVRVQPGASRDAIAGIELDAAGRAFLKVRVTQPAEGGKANRAVIRMLAKAFRVPASSIEVVGGAKDRRKVLAIAGGPEVAQRIDERLGALT